MAVETSRRDLHATLEGPIYEPSWLGFAEVWTGGLHLNFLNQALAVHVNLFARQKLVVNLNQNLQ